MYKFAMPQWNVVKMRMTLDAMIRTQLSCRTSFDFLFPTRKAPTAHFKNDNQYISKAMENYIDRISKEGRTVVQVGFLEQLRHIETLLGTLPQMNDCRASCGGGGGGGYPLRTKKRKLSNENDDEDNNDDNQRGGERQPLSDLDPNSRAAVSPASLSSSTRAVANIVRAVKQEIIVMAENCGRVSRWLQLELSFDDSELTRDYTCLIKEFMAAEDCAFATLGSIQKYYERRADLHTKLQKHPEIDDYAHAVDELDFTEWLHLRAVLKDLALNCTVLHNRASSVC
ncbi:hypothetical protein HDU90_000576 [Geranomyces variabilis]|nr:hypothetical protein HDU90_000576 [Geranomyces variabilis]